VVIYTHDEIPERSPETASRTQVKDTTALLPLLWLEGISDWADIALSIEEKLNHFMLEL
jgi:hypothetical protein